MRTEWRAARLKTNNGKKRSRFMGFFRKRSFQQALIAVVTILIAAVIIVDGSIPRRYKLSLGERSDYDITAPREIYNVYLTEKLAEEAASEVPPVMMRLENVTIDTINTTNELINEVGDARQSIDKNIREQGIAKTSEEYGAILEQERVKAAEQLEIKLKSYGIPFQKNR